jgi:hypothetical protein
MAKNELSKATPLLHLKPRAGTSDMIPYSTLYIHHAISFAAPKVGYARHANKSILLCFPGHAR